MLPGLAVLGGFQISDLKFQLFKFLLCFSDIVTEVFGVCGKQKVSLCHNIVFLHLYLPDSEILRTVNSPLLFGNNISLDFQRILQCHGLRGGYLDLGKHKGISSPGYDSHGSHSHKKNGYGVKLPVLEKCYGVWF